MYDETAQEEGGEKYTKLFMLSVICTLCESK